MRLLRARVMLMVAAAVHRLSPDVLAQLMGRFVVRKAFGVDARLAAWRLLGAQIGDEV